MRITTKRLQSAAAEAAAHAARHPYDAVRLRLLDGQVLEVEGADSFRSYRCHLPVEDGEGGEMDAHVPADMFQRAVRVVTSEEVELRVDKKRVLIAHGTGQLRLPMVDEVPFRASDLLDSMSGYEVLPAERVRDMARAVLALKQDERWQGVQVYGEDPGLRWVALGSTGALAADIRTPTGEGNRTPLPEALVPYDLLRRLTSLDADADADARFVWGDGGKVVAFEHAGQSWCYRTLNTPLPAEALPTLEAAVWSKEEGSLTVDSASLVAALRRAASTKPNLDKVRVQIEGGHLRVLSGDEQQGSRDELITDGDSIVWEGSFQLGYLLPLVALCSDLSLLSPFDRGFIINLAEGERLALFKTTD